MRIRTETMHLTHLNIPLALLLLCVALNLSVPAAAQVPLRGGSAGAAAPGRVVRQDNAGLIYGRVRDAESGELLPAASVTVPALRRRATTNTLGRFDIDGVPFGSYEVVVSVLGYMNDTSLVTVSAAESQVRLNVRLEIEAAEARTVVVKGRRQRETDAAALLAERTASAVTSVLSAESIARTPDVSAAEAVKRIPGVSITRVRGEARDAIIRGMEARYNSTLVDGIRIPSPAENTRVVSLDFLPSELLQRVEVTKVMTPAMESDAIGGAVNFIMRTAPPESYIRARAATGYGTMLMDNDFIGFRTDSILADPRERFAPGYRMTNADFPVDNVRLNRAPAPPDAMFEASAGTRLLDNRLGVLVAGSIRQNYQLSDVTRNYEAIDADNNTYFTHSEWRVHSHSKTKYGFNVKTDFAVDRANTLEASFIGLIRHNREARVLTDTGGLFVPTLIVRERSVFQQHTIWSAGLSGSHHLSALDLKWRGGWAFAQQYKPDRAELTTTSAINNGVVSSTRYFETLDRDWQRNTDRDWYAGVDITSLPGYLLEDISFAVGGLVRFKARKNDMNAYRLIAIPDAATGQMPVYKGLDSLTYQIANAAGTQEYADNNYEASEDNVAGYVEARWDTGPWDLLVGARVEMTSAEYETRDVNYRARVSARKTYADILPSLHVKRALDEFSTARLSIGRSMSRPSYFDLVPYNYVGEESRMRGNPELRRTISTNADLRYELYPSPERSWNLSAGAFFKLIEDPVETSLDLSNPSLPLLIPKNLGTATNYGLELTGGVTFLDHYSLIGSYTFTRSSITSDKIMFDRATSQTLVVKEERSLQGQSPHVASLGANYQDKEGGTMAQVSFVFTGERVARVSPYPNHDHLQSDHFSLDLALEQRVWGDLSVFLHATNLLDAPFELRLASGEEIETERFGRSIMVGVSFRAQ